MRSKEVATEDAPGFPKEEGVSGSFCFCHAETLDDTCRGERQGKACRNKQLRHSRADKEILRRHNRHAGAVKEKQSQNWPGPAGIRLGKRRQLPKQYGFDQKPPNQEEYGARQEIPIACWR